MYGYRLFFFDPSGPVRGERIARAVVLICESEAEAIAQAAALRGGDYAELWCCEHLVMIFNSAEG